MNYSITYEEYIVIRENFLLSFIVLNTNIFKLKKQSFLIIYTR